MVSHPKLTADEIELLSCPLSSGAADGAESPHPLGSSADGSDDPANLQRQLVAFESLHQEDASRFEDALSTGLQRIVEVRLERLQLMPYSQFAFSRTNPTCYCIVQATPLPASLALDLSPTILYPILDCLLGGGKLPCSLPDRPPTELEQRLAARITQMLLAELHDVWGPDREKLIQQLRVEGDAKNVTIVQNQTVNTDFRGKDAHRQRRRVHIREQTTGMCLKRPARPKTEVTRRAGHHNN